MNVLLHFLFNYAVVDALFGNAIDYVFLIIIFSVIVDLDHIPYLLRVKRGVIGKKFGAESRTRFHEICGMFVASVLASIAYFLVNTTAVQVIFLSYILHLFLDFISGKTRPFYPFSDKKVFVGLVPAKYRVATEVILTIIFGVMLWPSLESLAYLLL